MIQFFNESLFKTCCENLEQSISLEEGSCHIVSSTLLEDTDTGNDKTDIVSGDRADVQYKNDKQRIIITESDSTDCSKYFFIKMYNSFTISKRFGM